MLFFVANGLVITGLFILIGSIFPLHRLVYQLPVGNMRRRWVFQGGLIVFFILGYLSYAIAFWNQVDSPAGLIVPSVFFFGAVFVLITVILSLQTAQDVRRMTILEQENISDPLTGIYNRRYLDRRLAEELERARRYQLNLAVLLIDIDHFKLINDTYGHQAGDLVLRCWGSLILEVVRASDIAARYGGDEILIIAPGADTAAVFSLAERIRAKIETYEFAISGDTASCQMIRITVSIGGAALIPGIEHVEHLMEMADQALYQAKCCGRNCTVIAVTDSLQTVQH